MELVFFGSGPVAAQALEGLLEEFSIEAVITKPVPSHHRGENPVRLLCEQKGLRYLEPASKHELTTFVASEDFSSRLGIVIDYGLIIERSVIDSFPLGILNSHFSLLPQWRGADPITFAILSGQQHTGISIMCINERMDEGPLLAQAVYDIPPKATTPELTEALIDLSDATLKHIIPLYAAGSIDPAPQESVSLLGTIEPTYSKKLTKDDGRIDWHKPAAVIEREIRAYAGWPKSYCRLGETNVIILAANVRNDVKGQPGELEINRKQLIVTCGDSSGLEITRIQPEGKPAMDITAFLAGYSNRINNTQFV